MTSILAELRMWQETNSTAARACKKGADRIEALEAALHGALATLEAMHPDETQLTPAEVARLYNATTDTLAALLINGA